MAPKLSVFVTEVRDPREAVVATVAAERLGFHGAWFPSTMASDALTLAALSAAATERIGVGTAVVPMAVRHPMVVAQQALTVQAVARGRFRLGVGMGHPILVEQAYGVRPMRRLVDVRDHIGALCSAISAPDGSRWDGSVGAISVEPRLRVALVLGALSPRLAALGGALAGGVVTWLTPASYVGDVLVPAVASGAERTNVVAPPLVACVPVILTADREHARAAAEAEVGVALRLPAFRAMLESAGAIGRGQPADLGFTDVLLDGVVAWGDQERLVSRLAEYARAGVSEIAIAPIGVGPDADADRDRTRAAIAELVG